MLTNQRAVEIHENRVANHAVVGGVETFEHQLDLGVGFEGDVLSRELVVARLSRKRNTVANEDRALGSDNTLQACFVLDTKPTENLGFFVHLVREGFERNRKFRRRHRNVFERFDSVVQRNDGLVVRQRGTRQGNATGSVTHDRVLTLSRDVNSHAHDSRVLGRIGKPDIR